MQSPDSTLTCRELVDFLGEYRSGELDPQTCALFEDHLRECPDCVEYLRSYEETIRLARGAFAIPDAPVPAEVPEELVASILAARSRGRPRGSRKT